jgi:hypothetical protein
MTERTYGEAVAGDLAAKAAIWGPAIAGGLLLGPVGVLLGLVTSASILVGGSSDSPPPSSGHDVEVKHE